MYFICILSGKFSSSDTLQFHSNIIMCVIILIILSKFKIFSGNLIKYFFVGFQKGQTLFLCIYFIYMVTWNFVTGVYIKYNILNIPIYNIWKQKCHFQRFTFRHGNLSSETCCHAFLLSLLPLVLPLWHDTDL